MRPSAAKWRLLFVSVVLATVVLAISSPASAATITSAGPLTAIRSATDLNCTSTTPATRQGSSSATPHVARSRSPSAGTLYGPHRSRPGGPRPRDAFTPVSQTGPTGTGTTGDPFKIVTVVGLGGAACRSRRRTRTSSARSPTAPTCAPEHEHVRAEVLLYPAGDCFLQNSDFGFGRVDGSAVACTAGQDAGHPDRAVVPAHRGEQLHGGRLPRGLGADRAQLQPFPNTCSAPSIDNGPCSAGTSRSRPGAVTVSYLTTFSPLGIAPLTTTRPPTGDRGRRRHRRLHDHVTNPNTIGGESHDHRHAAGRIPYAAGSTTGATTSTRVIAPVLTWSGPFNVPAAGTCASTST